MIELKQVTKEYGHATVLKNITLTLEEPGIYCLLGRNGAGKTTLLKSIAGYQNVTSGSISVNGKAISTAALDSGVSYIENFAKHFNLPVRKLLAIAAEVNPDYDVDFAWDMMERFELDGKKKFRHLSLGMKTMVSTIICLASNREAVLLDEPVLGFDAIMRVEFYDMLQESFQKHPRIIIVSTHIIEEIAKTIQKLIILDKGRVRFFDTLQAVEEKAYSVSGLQKDVEAATQGLNVLWEDIVGGLATRYVFDKRPQQPGNLEIQPLGLQEFFVHMVGQKGGMKR
ncbi:MAG TPA: ABC transporter ATP-binding protein [Candidatus Acutalibacter ornithocaccae]|uniref:ABC transporter ATP-binding protein n=1 Tax=Candidatus Acutalibacter ornithocaccae TaxID=2838416 RepID=A0A9D2LWV8_9FIRM|nr:ABC transporter ATP-binding protein [Candidatus Acutalibacter ornithocaccae]